MRACFVRNACYDQKKFPWSGSSIKFANEMRHAPLALKVRFRGSLCSPDGSGALAGGQTAEQEALDFVEGDGLAEDGDVGGQAAFDHLFHASQI